MLLNGVHIEEDCVIAAGSLLTEGTRIPARSLVMGRPEITIDPETAEVTVDGPALIKSILAPANPSDPTQGKRNFPANLLANSVAELQT